MCSCAVTSLSLTRRDVTRGRVTVASLPTAFPTPFVRPAPVPRPPSSCCIPPPTSPPGQGGLRGGGGVQLPRGGGPKACPPPPQELPAEPPVPPLSCCCRAGYRRGRKMLVKAACSPSQVLSNQQRTPRPPALLPPVSPLGCSRASPEPSPSLLHPTTPSLETERRPAAPRLLPPPTPPQLHPDPEEDAEATPDDADSAFRAKSLPGRKGDEVVLGGGEWSFSGDGPILTLTPRSWCARHRLGWS